MKIVKMSFDGVDIPITEDVEKMMEDYTNELSEYTKRFAAENGMTVEELSQQLRTELNSFWKQ